MKYWFREILIFSLVLLCACAPFVERNSDEAVDQSQTESQIPEGHPESNQSESQDNPPAPSDRPKIDVTQNPAPAPAPAPTPTPTPIPAPTPTPAEANPKPEIKSPPGSHLRRGDLPPRAEFAEEDISILATLGVEARYRKLAEIYQYDGFRAVQVRPQDSKQINSVPKILLLTYTLPYLKLILNYLAGCARVMRNGKPNSASLHTRYTGGIASYSAGRIQLAIPPEFEDFISYVDQPLEGKMGEFWPEGRRIKIKFGTRSVIFIISTHEMHFGGSEDSLNGKQIFQTPWILRALEGETINAIWHATSSAQAGNAGGTQFGDEPREVRRHTTWHNLFEEVWDSRSQFFPDFPDQKYAYRLISLFQTVPFSRCMYLFGIEELKLENFSDLLRTIDEIGRKPGFRFINTIP